MSIRKKHLLLLGSAVLSLCVSIALAVTSSVTAGRLDSQKAAERWENSGDLHYAQISVFAGTEAGFSPALADYIGDAVKDALREAAIEQKKDGPRLWYDAYSMQGSSMTMQGGKHTISGIAVTAVGGDFFTMHPMRLLDGNYFDDDDLMQDRIVIDEQLAWDLFGSYKVSGMEVVVNGIRYPIAGVIRHETDSASQTACGDAPRAYVPLSLYQTWQGADAGSYGGDYGEYGDYYGEGTGSQTNLSCYEIVMPDLVRGYALKTVSDTLTGYEDIRIVQNTGRFSLGKRWDTLRHLEEMVVIPDSISYPYWENAARITEFRLALLLGGEILFVIWPVLLGLALLWKGYRRLENSIARMRQARKDRYRTTKDIQI